MFERLIEWAEWFLDLFIFWQVIDQYEAGVVLRWGKYARTAGPGLHWIWPLGVEKVLTDNVVPTTSSLDEQIVTTADNRRVAISVMIRWRIHDIKKILLDVENADEVLVDCAAGEVESLVNDYGLDAIRTDDWDDELYRSIRKRGWAWGIEVQEVQVVQFAETRVLRVIM